MTARGIISALAMMVLALLAALAFLLFREPLPVSSSRAELNPASSAYTRVGLRRPNGTNYFFFPAGFSWSSLESTNYATYVQNLRAIGCPEETVRDVIVADVAKLYSQQRSRIWAAAESVPYWKTGDNLTAQMTQELRRIDVEERALIRELLGVDLDMQLQRFSSDPPARPIDLAYLPVDKQGRVREILQRNRKAQQVFRDRAGSVWTDVDSRQLQDLQDQEEAELRAALSSQEYSEYEIRESELSFDLREQLRSLNLTESEFRKVYQARRAYSQADASLAEAGTAVQTGESADSVRAQAEDQLDQTLRETLGSERWDRYQRAQEPSYQTLSKLADRLSMPAAVVDQAYEYLHAAQVAMEKVIDDPTVDVSARDAALQSMSQEASSGLRGILGAEGFTLFLGAGGRDWLNPQP